MNRLLVVSAMLALAGCNQAVSRIDDGRAIDGDTFVSAGVHYRLTFDESEYPDAPELPGHCRPGRQCAPGDPYAARAALQAMLDRRVECQSYGADHYGRTLVDCTDWRTGVDIGQQLVVTGHAQVCVKSPHHTECHA